MSCTKVLLTTQQTYENETRLTSIDAPYHDNIYPYCFLGRDPYGKVRRHHESHSQKRLADFDDRR